MNMNVKEFTFENLGLWPLWFRVLCIFIVFLAILFFGYQFDLNIQFDQLRQLQIQHSILLKKFIKRKEQTSKMNIYKIQLKKQEDELINLSKQLPKYFKVTELLENISKAGLNNGLIFKFIKPQTEVKKNFYMELPIKVEVFGGYHQIRKFLSKISRLDQIVTLDNMIIQPVGDAYKDLNKNAINKQLKEPSTKLLLLQITIKAYRYHQVLD